MKKTIAAIIALSFIAFLGYACDNSSSSSGGIVKENVSVSGASAAKLYYPANLSSVVGATTMSAGYTQNLSNVEWLSTRLAQQGYVVLGMTPSNNWGMVSGWITMHKNGISKLQQLNSSHAALRGKIDTNKLQISGHSKGGGGSLAAAAQLGGSVASVVAMAPYCGGEYSMSSLRSMRANTFIQAGGGDTLATNSMTREEYGYLPGTISKMYQEYSGMSHMSFTNGATGSTANTLSTDTIAWMKYYLDGDTSKKSTLADRSGSQRYEWSDLGTTGSGSTPTPTGPVYSFVAVHSGKALDTWEWGTTDGTNIAQYDYWAGDAQKFTVTSVDNTYYSISPIIAPSQAMDVSGCVTDPGANIQTWTNWNGECQQFRLQSAGDGAYQIIARNSGLCVTVENASTEDGANVIQDVCTNGAQHQMFKMIQH